MWHVTCDMLYVTCDMWLVTCDKGFFFLRQKSAQKCRKVSKMWDFIVSVILSAHAERVGVSRMQDFFCNLRVFPCQIFSTKPVGLSTKMLFPTLSVCLLIGRIETAKLDNLNLTPDYDVMWSMQCKFCSAQCKVCNQCSVDVQCRYRSSPLLLLFLLTL